MPPNNATHKHANVRAWLAKRPRYHLHFTLTSASWMNLVERWFGIISQRAIKRGSFRNVTALVKTIDEFIEHYNQTAKPFAWVATAESIFGKLERLTTRICGIVDQNQPEDPIHVPQEGPWHSAGR